MSFSAGFARGASTVGAWKDRKEEEYRRETENKMFQSAINFKKQELDAEGQEIAGMEGQRQDIMGMFGKASVGDIAGAIVDNHVAGGGKINDQTYSMAMGVATKLFGVAKMEQDYQERKSMFGLKTQKVQADIDRTRQIIDQRNQTASVETQAPFKLTADGKIDPTSVDMGSEWYIAQPKDIKRGIANAQGFKSIPAPATVYDMGDDEPIVETVAEKEEEKKKSKKLSWKDYLN